MTATRLFKGIQGHRFCYRSKPVCDFLLINNTIDYSPICVLSRTVSEFSRRFGQIIAFDRECFHLTPSFRMNPGTIWTPKFGFKELETSPYRAVHNIHCVSKNCAKLFLSELCQIYTNFDNFGTKVAKRLKLCKVHAFSTSPNSHHHTTVLNANVPNCYVTL